MEHAIGAPPAAAIPADAAARFIAELFAPLRPSDADPERIGVYLATSDAGASASIALWQEALAQGPGFADPRLFPWTLASSAAAFVALRLEVRGPVHALVGGSEAVVAVLQHAIDDLAAGRVDTALVGALDAGVAEVPGSSAAAGVVVRLARDGAAQLGRVESTASSDDVRDLRRAPVVAGAASSSLRLACEAIERRGSLVIGSETEGFVLVRAASELLDPSRSPHRGEHA
jgi:hypothetical protein